VVLVLVVVVVIAQEGSAGGWTKSYRNQSLFPWIPRLLPSI
jgi:hypothetical protein